VKYEFINKHCGELGVRRLCRMLSVSPGGYYGWRGRGESLRTAQDRELLAHINQVHQDRRQAYGAVKTWRELNDRGIACGKHRVARLRRFHGIEARRKRRFRVMVEHHHTAPAAPNLVKRQFQVAAADQVWVGDMTFIRTRAGFLHLAVLLDLYSRRVVGWSMSDKPNIAVALNALRMALVTRRPVRGLTHHTDQGPQYSARAYRDVLQANNLSASMSSKGNPYDNAVAESFFSNLKNELVHHSDFMNREQARSAIFDYIEIFYNRQRMHQTLGYLSPMQFEQANGVC
jgi:transposase InsO family protein